MTADRENETDIICFILPILATNITTDKKNGRIALYSYSFNFQLGGVKIGDQPKLKFQKFEIPAKPALKDLSDFTNSDTGQKYFVIYNSELCLIGFNRLLAKLNYYLLLDLIRNIAQT